MESGKELTDHKRFTMATNIAVYFVVRKALAARLQGTPTGCYDSAPRKARICRRTVKLANYIARELNERPRMTLGYATAGHLNKGVTRPVRFQTETLPKVGPA